VGLLVLTAGVGCGSSTGGDPNGQRLRELGNDSVFAGVPMSSTMVRCGELPRDIETRVRERWMGRPERRRELPQRKTPRVVFRYFARRAAASGWHPTAKGSLGVTDRWAKSYADGAAATLVLAQLGRSRVTSGRLYLLQGGIAPAT
jgi:hypothetical protein